MLETNPLAGRLSIRISHWGGFTGVGGNSQNDTHSTHKHTHIRKLTRHAKTVNASFSARCDRGVHGILVWWSNALHETISISIIFLTLIKWGKYITPGYQLAISLLNDADASLSLTSWTKGYFRLVSIIMTHPTFKIGYLISIPA